MKTIHLFYSKYRSLLLYAVIGGVAVIVDVGLFTLLNYVTDLPLPLTNFIAIFVAMVYSFIVNAFLNFKTTNGLGKRFISFGAVTFIGYIISTICLSLALNILDIDSSIAKIITLPIIFIVQFALNSRFTFKQKQGSEDLVVESIV